MNNEQHQPFEEVIDEIMRKESEPSYEALTRWTERFPEHRDALASYFATWAIQEKLPEEEPLDEVRAGQRMVSQAMNLLYQQNAANAAKAEEPVATRLHEAVKCSGLSLEDVAAKCGLDESILLKLDRRLIHYPSIPALCFERLSTVLAYSVDMVQRMLLGRPIAAAANRAKNKPVIKTEDFIDAVRKSNLSDEMKADWARFVAEQKSAGDTK